MRYWFIAACLATSAVALSQEGFDRYRLRNARMGDMIRFMEDAPRTFTLHGFMGGDGDGTTYGAGLMFSRAGSGGMGFNIGGQFANTRFDGGGEFDSTFFYGDITLPMSLPFTIIPNASFGKIDGGPETTSIGVTLNRAWMGLSVDLSTSRVEVDFSGSKLSDWVTDVMIGHKMEGGLLVEFDYAFPTKFGGYDFFFRGTLPVSERIDLRAAVGRHNVLMIEGMVRF